MQAMMLIAVFSFILSLGASIIVGTTSSSAQLTQQWVAQTKEYFSNVSKIVVNDLTPTNFRAMLATITTLDDFLNNTPEIARMSLGRWADPTVDAWGMKLRGAVVTEYRVIYNGAGETVQVPVSGIALVSAGPNRSFETTIPINPTLASLQGIAAPSGSDDIIAVFNDESAHREVFSRLNVYLARIGDAVMHEYQLRVAEYEANLISQYKAQVQTSSSTTPDIEALWNSDPNAPVFMDINSPSNRAALGIEEDFAKIERYLPQGGNLVVTSTYTASTRVLKISITNNASNPTPWGNPANSLSYSITLQGGPQ